MSPKPFALALLLLLFGVATPAFAYKLAPMSQVLSPSGAGTSKSFELINDGSARIALELSVTTLERDLDYHETNVNADEHFLVHPAQILLAPGARQTVRVTWVGDPSPARELTYRLVVEELPITGVSASVETRGAVRILMTFRATLYIRPSKAAPKISVASVERIESKLPSGAGQLAITVQNTGTAHGSLKRCATTATVAKTTVTLPAESLLKLQEGRILAGNKRRYLVPWPAELPSGAASVNLHCSAEL